MLTSQQVTLGTGSSSLLAQCTAAPALKVRVQAASIATQLQIYLGDASVTTSSGSRLAINTQASEPLELTLQPGDSIYGIASTGSPVVEVLTWEADC